MLSFEERELIEALAAEVLALHRMLAGRNNESASYERLKIALEEFEASE